MICHINQPTDFLQVGCDRVGKTTWRTANGWNFLTRREGSLHIRGIQAAYRAHPERTRRGKSDGSVTRPAGSLTGSSLGGDTLIWTRSGSHWGVHCCATVCRSTYCRFSLGGNKVVWRPQAFFPWNPVRSCLSLAVPLPRVARFQLRHLCPIPILVNQCHQLVSNSGTTFGVMSSICKRMKCD